MEDLNEAGGVYAVMKELTKKDLLNTDIITCTGKTVGGKHSARRKTRRAHNQTYRQPVLRNRRHRGTEGQPCARQLRSKAERGSS